MTKLSHGIYITLVALYLVTGKEQAKESKYKLNNKELEGSFNKLLYAVTSVNKERLDALKKFHELQNYVPKVTRTGDQDVVAFIVPHPKENNLERDVSIIDQYNKKRPNIEPVFLRQWKGCNKSAAKSCKKACKKAFKEVCSNYKCKKSMKKSFKKSCKTKCNAEFRKDDKDDSSSSEEK